MKLDNGNFELIERYLNKELSEREIYDFERRLKEDRSFSEEVDYHRVVNDLILDRGLLNIKQKIQSYNDKQRSAGNSKYFISAGIIIILSISIFVFTKNDKNPPPIQQQIPQIEASEEITDESVKQHAKEEQKLTLPNRPKPTSSYVIAETEEAYDNNTDTIRSPLLIEQIMPKKKQEYYAPLTNTPVFPEISLQKQKEEVCILKDISASFTIEPTCSTHPSGEISIESFNSEGVGPFEYSLNNHTFKSSGEFKNLPGGIYYLTVKDARGCIGKVEEQIFIEEKACITNEFSFSPLLGEVWKFPLNKNTTGKVQILDRNGRSVYSSSINNGAPAFWDGTTTNGQDLPSGIYTFSLKIDKKIIEGTVTIIK